MPENDYREVRIIHPETGGIATVPETALAQHYRAGWTLLADDLQSPPQVAGAPEPLTQAEVETARQQAAQAGPAAAGETSAKAGGAKAAGGKTAGKNSEE